MAAVSIWGIMNGGADRLIFGMDSYGNICGKNNTKAPASAHRNIYESEFYVIRHLPNIILIYHYIFIIKYKNI